MPGQVKMEDTTMEDVPTSGQQAAAESQDGGETMLENKSEVEEEIPIDRVRVLPGSTDYAASYEFLDEGHTLGNALRYIIMKNPEVEFCAYAIPHPSEAKMNLRVQTYDTMKAVDALLKGLRDLEDLCDVVADEFWTKRNEFVQAEGKMVS